MSTTLKVLLAAFLFAGAFTQNRSCDHFLGFGQTRWHETDRAAAFEKELIRGNFLPVGAVAIKELTDQLEEPFRNSTLTDEVSSLKSQFVKYAATSPTSEPIKVDWRVLIDIDYKLKYFDELDMEMYSPVFTEAVEKLHGKEVIIQGYVIPFDEEEELLSLSFNPYASCFFCGKASPASVISMYLKDERKRYKMDDFKKFRGTLYLNHNDPNEFYYILRDAAEEK